MTNIFWDWVPVNQRSAFGDGAQKTDRDGREDSQTLFHARIHEGEAA
jgi:hypothetical protein